MAITLPPGRNLDELKRRISELEREVTNFSSYDTGPDRVRLQVAYRSVINQMERLALDHLRVCSRSTSTPIGTA